MKTIITIEYDSTNEVACDIVKGAIGAASINNKIALVSIQRFYDTIVYQNGDKILRVGDTVKHSNQFFKDTGTILSTPKDFFEGFVCVKWKDSRLPPTGELGEDLIKVE